MGSGTVGVGETRLVQLGLLVVQLLELRHVDAQIEHLLLRLLEAIPLGAQLVQPRLLRPQRLPVRARLQEGSRNGQGKV